MKQSPLETPSFRKLNIDASKFDRIGILLEELNRVMASGSGDEQAKIKKYFSTFIAEDKEQSDFNAEVMNILNGQNPIESKASLEALQEKYKA